jgi:site-specific recombinase XerD
MFVWEAGVQGKPCNPSYFRTQYKKALEAIEGMRYLSPHSCRHTYVSQMQALGVDLATIQSIVGHADMDMTKHYLHVQDPIRQAAVQKFSDAFGNED